ncbi:MAG: GAF domain-containing protein [Chloroflexota bacterium]
MYHILIVSTNEALEQEVYGALHGSVILSRVTTIAQAQAQLLATHGEDTPGVLILVDASGQANAVGMCREMRQGGLPKQVKLIVIIENPLDRQAVLQAGADDYLLAPLISAVLSTRLLVHLERLELAWEYEETQVYAAQAAFLVLLSRLIGGQSELKVILSQTLDQTVSLLNAWAAELWLWTADGDRLELVSSLTPASSSHRTPQRIKGEGLIGWIASQELPLILVSAHESAHFDRRIDAIDGQEHYAILAVPLKNQAVQVGSLVIYHTPPRTFTPGDAKLLEAIASLVASAIINAQAIQQLQNSSTRRHTLYEMSRKIAESLDLQSTVSRALQWLNRMCDTEASLLWLTNEKTQELEPVSALGVEIDQTGQLKLALEGCPVDQLTNDSAALLIHNADDDPCECLVLFEHLGIRRRNFLAIKMLHHSQVIGAITLLNKIGDRFDKAEIEMLSAATEMIGIAISNAQLHEKTLKLIHESERMHKLALQNERLATIGRLTASLAHEINNPMQALRGALTLAREELHNPQELAGYLEISMVEVERVVNLVQRLRQVYQPSSDKPELVPIQSIIHDALSVARKELSRQNVKMHIDISPSLGKVAGITSQLHLAFLCIFLRISDLLGSAGGGVVRLSALDQGDEAGIEFIASAGGVDWIGLGPDAEESSEHIPLDEVIGLSLARDILIAHGGNLNVDCCEQRTCLQVTLPQEH